LLQKADKRSASRYGGHGSALAQVHSHLILPLCNYRDKVTQVWWGIRDFEHRFGRYPEGIWLSETAVDTETLEVLASHGIQYTILAPRQAKAVRPILSEQLAVSSEKSAVGSQQSAVGSAEWQRPIVWKGEMTDWESTLFVDAGAVADHPSDLHARVGVGAGLRWRSPVGPVQADLAWGVQAKELRLHLRLGFSF